MSKDLLRESRNHMQKMHECEADERDVADCIARIDAALAEPEPVARYDGRRIMPAVAHQLGFFCPGRCIRSEDGKYQCWGCNEPSPPAQAVPEVRQQVLGELLDILGGWRFEARATKDKGGLILANTLEDYLRSQLSAQPEQAAPEGFVLVPREDLLRVARMAEALKQPCGMDPESPQALRNSRYADIALRLHQILAAAPQPGKEDAKQIPRNEEGWE